MSGVSRSGAIKKTRVAQVAGLALVALTAGAVIYTPPLPEAKSPQPSDFPIEDSQPNPGNPGDNTPTSLSVSDADNIGERFNDAGNIIKTEKPIIPPVVGTTQDEGTQDIAEATGWKYLGGVFEPSVNFALVEINGSQRMLKEGMKLADLNAEVISVEEGRIEINRNGKREKITLAKSNGALVSVSDPAESGASASGVIAPGMQTARDYQSARDRQSIESDADKRRAEFERRKLERENRLVGIDR